ncbi:hypothetical protein G7Y89_g12177 [Cudoniella acicularis]|uniref:Tat pathway signal sequence n=1 Tax=Cudoniella acicularis TaxID=354080 RepID=A0A8H4R9D3_9HELO|nr:hypothetical protein G7Y89_g12177 [Cudoniella acicularis]
MFIFSLLFQRRESTYSALHDSPLDFEERVKVGEDNNHESSGGLRWQVQKRKTQRFDSVNVLLLCASILLAFAIGFNLVARAKQASDAVCMKNMWAYSPVQEAAEWEWTTFPDYFSPDQYSGPPSVEVEEAWSKLWDFGAFTVPFDKIPLLNKSSVDQDYRQVRTERGMEVGALLEGAHQIHCLNLARQYIYRDQWDYSSLQSFSGGKRVQRHHVDHCLNTLLININCWSDVTPFLLEYTGHGLVKRGAQHRCKRFDKLVDWVNDHVAFDAAAE